MGLVILCHGKICMKISMSGILFIMQLVNITWFSCLYCNSKFVSLNFRFLLWTTFSGTRLSEKSVMLKQYVWVHFSPSIVHILCGHTKLVVISRLLKSAVIINVFTIFFVTGYKCTLCFREVFAVDFLFCIKWGRTTHWSWLGKRICWCSSCFETPSFDRSYLTVSSPFSLRKSAGWRLFWNPCYARWHCSYCSICIFNHPGFLLRELKDFWRVALLMSTLVYPRNIDCTEDLLNKNFELERRISLFKAAEDAILKLGIRSLF